MSPLLFVHLSSHFFYPAAVVFTLQSFLFRRSPRPGRTSSLECNRHALDQFNKAGDSVLSVLQLTAVLLCLDDHHAIGSDSPVALCQETLFVEIRQGGGDNIEAQMDGGGDFVDILPARTLYANRVDFDFFSQQGDRRHHEGALSGVLSAISRSINRCDHKPPNGINAAIKTCAALPGDKCFCAAAVIMAITAHTKNAP